MGSLIYRCVLRTIHRIRNLDFVSNEHNAVQNCDCVWLAKHDMRSTLICQPINPILTYSTAIVLLLFRGITSSVDHKFALAFQLKRAEVRTKVILRRSPQKPSKVIKCDFLIRRIMRHYANSQKLKFI